MRKIFLAGFAACVALGAPTNAPAQNQIEAGEQVYEEHCATCHGVKLRRTGAISDELCRAQNQQVRGPK